MQREGHLWTPRLLVSRQLMRDCAALAPLADGLGRHAIAAGQNALTKRFGKDPSFASVRRTSIKDEGDRSGEIHHFGIPVFSRVDPA